MKFLTKTVKLLVMMGAVIILSTLSIDAFDNRGDLSGSLLGSAIGIDVKEVSRCPEGMSYVQHPERSFCIDTHTASAGAGCPYPDPSAQKETRVNMSSSDCEAVSEEGKTPWRYISQTQAREVCRMNGKYLASGKEWYIASQGTPVVEVDMLSNEDCNLNSNWNGDDPGKTGTGKNCVSGSGAYDMVGNVWEWVDGEVRNGEFESVLLPDEGYITEVNGSGIPTETDPNEPDPNHENDELWLKREGTFAVMRGGFHGSGDSGGIYAFHAKMGASFAGRAVGFRCAAEPIR